MQKSFHSCFLMCCCCAREPAAAILLAILGCSDNHSSITDSKAGLCLLRRRFCFLNWSTIWSFMLQMAAGVSATLLCHWSTAQAKNNYAKLVAIRFATRASQNLLHTLIPPGVMKKFCPEKNPVCTSQPICMCMVMFCMFDYNVLTRDDFDWIESLVADLDRAVTQSGEVDQRQLGVSKVSCKPTRRSSG